MTITTLEEVDESYDEPESIAKVSTDLFSSTLEDLARWRRVLEILRGLSRARDNTDSQSISTSCSGTLLVLMFNGLNRSRHTQGFYQHLEASCALWKIH